MFSLKFFVALSFKPSWGIRKQATLTASNYEKLEMKEEIVVSLIRLQFILDIEMNVLDVGTAELRQN